MTVSWVEKRQDLGEVQATRPRKGGTEKVPVTFSIKRKTYLKAFELINKTIRGWRMYKRSSNESVPVPLMRWHKTKPE